MSNQILKDTQVHNRKKSWLWAAAIGSLTLALCLGVFLRDRSEPNTVSIPAPGGYLSFTCDYPPMYEISGYDVLSRLEVFRFFDPPSKSHDFRWNDHSVKVTYRHDRGSVEIRVDGNEVMTLEVPEVIRRAKEYSAKNPKSSTLSVPQIALTTEKENDKIKLKAYFDDVSAESRDETLSIAHFKSDILIKFKNL